MASVAVVRELRGHESAALCVRFTEGGEYCLSGGKDRVIKLWNPHRGVDVHSYHGHGYEVRDVASTSDKTRIVSCGGDRQVFLWDVATGKVLRKFHGHDTPCTCCTFAANAQVVVSGGEDKAIKIWDCRSGSSAAIQVIDRFHDSVSSIHANDADIVAGSVDGSVRTFDLRRGQETIDSLGQPVNGIAQTQDRTMLAVACLCSEIVLLDRKSGRLLNTYRGHINQSSKTECALIKKEAFLACGSEDGAVYFWDVLSASQLYSVAVHNGVVTSLSAHPSAPSLLSAGTDGLIKVLEVAL